VEPIRSTPPGPGALAEKYRHRGAGRSVGPALEERSRRQIGDRLPELLVGHPPVGASVGVRLVPRHVAPHLVVRAFWR
jgi:hypothetical protein